MHEVFDHTADLGLRIRSTSLNALFEEAALAFSSVLVANLEDVRGVQTRICRVSSDALDYLMFDWLNELLYFFESERLLFSEIQVRMDGTSLEATCRGEPVDFERHRMEHEVKAITYHGLRVEQDDAGWLAEIILDI